MGDGIKLQVTDMHTAGEPVRIVTEGYPQLRGKTILERLRDARDNHDYLRGLLMREPRGHAEMYGVIPTEPCHPKAALSVLFIHNGGYSAMCGHATIAMGRFAVDQGLVPVGDGTGSFVLECPCGLVEVRADVLHGKTGRVSFESVAGYVHDHDLRVKTRLSGDIDVDIAYGGAYYAVLPTSELGLDLRNTSLSELKARAVDITESIRGAHAITHPTDDELAYLYGTIFTDRAEVSKSGVNHHLCFFGQGQLDRSPTGSGVTARLALAYANGEVGMGDSARFAGISGEVFEGEISRPGNAGNYRGIHTLVSGQAWYTARAELILEAGDPIADGYLDPITPGEIWN